MASQNKSHSHRGAARTRSKETSQRQEVARHECHIYGSGSCFNNSSREATSIVVNRVRAPLSRCKEGVWTAPSGVLIVGVGFQSVVFPLLGATTPCLTVNKQSLPTTVLAISSAKRETNYHHPSSELLPHHRTSYGAAPCRQ